MPHIHDLYDFVISVFIVHDNRVLMVYHKRYEEWLPIGGHIELDEDPEEALYREIEEECGLRVEIIEKSPDISHPGVKPIPAPSFMDVHHISSEHKHIAFVYFARALSSQAVLHEREHKELKWFDEKDLLDSRFKIIPSIQFYCREALRVAG